MTFPHSWKDSEWDCDITEGGFERAKVQCKGKKTMGWGWIQWRRQACNGLERQQWDLRVIGFRISDNDQLSVIGGDGNVANLGEKKKIPKKASEKMERQSSAGFSDSVCVCVCAAHSSWRPCLSLFPSWDPNQGNELMRFKHPLRPQTH